MHGPIDGATLEFPQLELGVTESHVLLAAGTDAVLGLPAVGQVLGLDCPAHGRVAIPLHPLDGAKGTVAGRIAADAGRGEADSMHTHTREE